MDFEIRAGLGNAYYGVMDVSTSWMREMTDEDLAMIADGQRDAFDAAVAEAMKDLPASMRQTLEWRQEPYEMESLFGILKSLEAYNLRDVASQISCPLFIADHDDEQFWPEQSEQLREAITTSVHLARFTREDGANWHCQPLARALYDQRLFEWLDAILLESA